MRTVALSILLAASAAFAFPASAQTAADPRGEQQPAKGAPGPEISRFETGVRALKANNLAQAERIFAEIVRRENLGYTNFSLLLAKRPRAPQASAEANFYLGVTRMNLGKWEEAKEPLEIAAAEFPAHPDPKSRLGVTYAQLGDMDGAMKQRADLIKMSDACKDACALSPYIAGGIEMIDAALARFPVSVRS